MERALTIHCAHDEVVALDSLKPNPANPNKHPPEQIALLAKIIKAQGWRNPIVVSNRSGLITKGHARLAAASRLGCKTVPVDRQDYGSEKEEWADMIADNRIAELAEADRTMLRELAEQLDDGAFDMDLTGFDQAALEELMTAAPPLSDIDAEPQIDKAEELRKKWGVKRGQIWQLGEHRLMCGDATKDCTRLLNGDKADCLFADPPYGMRLDAKFSGMHKANKYGKGGNDYKPVIGDQSEFDPTPLLIVTKDVKEQFWWGADYYRAGIPKGGSWFVWDKRANDAGMHLDDLIGSHFELCWSRQNHKREVLRILWAGHHGMQREDTKSRQHPTQKPTELVAWFLARYSTEIVADIFCGSGTTIIACEQLGRKCRAMEIDPGYVAVAIQRWADATGKIPRLLTEAEPLTKKKKH